MNRISLRAAQLDFRKMLWHLAFLFKLKNISLQAKTHVHTGSCLFMTKVPSNLSIQKRFTDKQGVDRHRWRAALVFTAYCPIHSATCIHQLWTLRAVFG